MKYASLPITAEEDHWDYVCQRHDECGCEGVAEPCECIDDCAICHDIRESIMDSKDPHRLR